MLTLSSLIPFLTHPDILPLLTSRPPTNQHQRNPLRHTNPHPSHPAPRRQPLPNPQNPHPKLPTHHSAHPLPSLPQPHHPIPLPHHRASDNTNLHPAPHSPCLSSPTPPHPLPLPNPHNPTHPPPQPHFPPTRRNTRILLHTTLRTHPPQRLLSPPTCVKRRRCRLIYGADGVGVESHCSTGTG